MGSQLAVWTLSNSSDPRALTVVDGTGVYAQHGPHYSRRSPGSKTFTGVGQEIVLVTEDGSAVWAVVRQRTPSRRGSGASRGRSGQPDATAYVWRNMLFRNLGPRLSSELIREATALTYRLWQSRYGEIPTERLRTEIDLRKVRSQHPGYCYLCAGWEKGPVRSGKRFLYAPTARSDAQDGPGSTISTWAYPGHP